MSTITRRDVLKLSAAFLGGGALSFLSSSVARMIGKRAASSPNIIVLVLDAMSARHLSLYGYQRHTTPALERFAGKANVYHSHYSGGSFTTSGTATLLTGLYPWTHRAITLGGLVKRSLSNSSIFGLLGDEYTRLAFTQNQLANLLLHQFSQGVDELLSRQSFSLQQNAPLLEENFKNDYSIGYYTFTDFLGASAYYVNSASLSLGLLDAFSLKRNEIKTAPSYPLGYPSDYQTYFRIGDVLSGIEKNLLELSAGRAPFFSYFHLLPPHSPYNPQRNFLNLFLHDGMKFTAKPVHPLSPMKKAQDKLVRLRMMYDAFIADVDHEVGLFLSRLEEQGLLDSSYLILTSDHGELFERGEYGHGSPLLYDSGIHVPLIIHSPGQTQRKDVYSLTSHTDLAPTILSMANQGLSAKTEGNLLPELGGADDAGRSVFTIYARENSAFLPLKRSVISVNQGSYHLLYYRGYEDGYDGKIEFYDLDSDPEEMHDLSAGNPAVARQMKAELLDALAAADRPYERG